MAELDAGHRIVLADEIDAALQARNERVVPQPRSPTVPQPRRSTLVDSMMTRPAPPAA
jgi:hypothetical protein